ncbi:MAG: hypothetical protein J6S14_15475 [Clostridia bacterium]|nr:hypothetical protein [Clostridia bacterium]
MTTNTTAKTIAWICTDPDTYQYARRLSETEFEFVQMENRRDQYCAFTGIVDIMDYFGNKEAQEELRIALGMFGYDNWTELEAMYGEDTFQIAAECIFEAFFCAISDHTSDTAEDCRQWLDDYMAENQF